MKRYLPLLLTMLATPAFAHTGVDHVHSLASGFLHPLTGFDHLAAMLSVGFIGSRFTGLRKLVAPAAFLAAMVAGYGMAAAGISLPAVETAILASVVALGAFCVVPVRLVTATLVAAACAVFHGHAHGMEAGASSAVSFGFGFVVASAGLMLAGMLAGTHARPAFLRVAGRD